MFGLAHAAGWEPYSLRDLLLGHASRVGSVLYRSYTTSHYGRLLRSTADDLDRDLSGVRKFAFPFRQSPTVTKYLLRTTGLRTCFVGKPGCHRLRLLDVSVLFLRFVIAHGCGWPRATTIQHVKNYPLAPLHRAEARAWLANLA